MLDHMGREKPPAQRRRGAMSAPNSSIQPAMKQSACHGRTPLPKPAWCESRAVPSEVKRHGQRQRQYDPRELQLQVVLDLPTSEDVLHGKKPERAEA